MAPKSNHPNILLAAVVMATAFSSPGMARSSDEPRPYSLSVETVYGREVSRRTYLDEIQRKLQAWAAAGGPMHASIVQGTADLHLRVILDEVDAGRAYPEVSGERDVFRDIPTSATSPYLYHTRFEVRVELVDPHVDDRLLFQDRFTVYNETRETKVITDPRQRSWDDNLQFLLDRTNRFLRRRDGRIRRYLRENPRPPAGGSSPAEADPPH
jgi:hypothetical protein